MIQCDICTSLPERTVKEVRAVAQQQLLLLRGKQLNLYDITCPDLDMTLVVN